MNRVSRPDMRWTWLRLGSAPTGPKGSAPSPTATGSTESWAELLRGLKRAWRARRCSPPATGRSDSGRRSAMCSPPPPTSGTGSTRRPTCSMPCRPRCRPRPAGASREIWDAEDRTHAEAAWTGAAPTSRRGRRPSPSSRRSGGATRVLRAPGRALDPPSDLEPDRVDLRGRARRRNVTKGPGSRAAGLAMCFKLIEAAEGRWRRVNAPELVAFVRAGAKFVSGRLIERTDQEDAA